VSTQNGSIAAAVPASAARVERRFRPMQGAANRLALGLGALGSAALGAGVYGAWLSPHEVRGAVALLLGGSAALVACFLSSPRQVPELWVGDLGVTLGDPTETPRVAWYEIQQVKVVGDVLRLTTERGQVDVPLVAHARGVTRILAEASLRMGERVDVSPAAHARLPPLADSEGELVPGARLQLAGRQCVASGKGIIFEGDARLCNNCAALYHVRYVPPRCLRCERPFENVPQAARAVEVPATPARFD
jgi:hypothetical protein